MKFFKRGSDKEPLWTDNPAPDVSQPPAPSPSATPPPSTPPPEAEPSGPIRKVDGGWSIHVETVDEAKQAIAELKDKKRDLQLAKKEIAAEQADVRAQHAQHRAGKLVMPKGGGTFGMIMRTGIQSSRRSDRMRMQAEIQSFNDRKALIDSDVRQIDGVIAQMQQYIVENAPAKTPRQPTPKPASASEVTEKLKALVELKEVGLISEAEYETKRTELLARL